MSFQAYLDNIQGKTGKTPDDFRRLAEARGLGPQACAERFATLSLPKSQQGWRSHPVLGFVRRR